MKRTRKHEWRNKDALVFALAFVGRWRASDCKHVWGKVTFDTRLRNSKAKQYIFALSVATADTPAIGLARPVQASATGAKTAAMQMQTLP